MDLIHKVEQELKSMVAVGDHVIVGVSGGADSVGLLCCLKMLEESNRISIEAVHVNHGIRGEEADRDERSVEELCEMLGIPLRCEHISVPQVAEQRGLSWEEAGRMCRYEAFERFREDWEQNHPFSHAWIAVAHHREDQAETVLMNLIRGTGIRGIGGMRPIQGAVIRPFLSVSRDEIRQWLREHSISWVEDETNRANEYTRNRIRNRLIPWMREELNPRVTEHLAATAEQAAEIDEYLQLEADQWIRKHSTVPGELPVEELNCTHPALRKRILLTVLSDCAGQAKDLTLRHVDALVNLAAGPRGRSIDLPYGIRALRERELLRIHRGGESMMADGMVTEWEMECRTFPYGGEKIPEKEYTKWFDYDKINGTVCLRHRESGDVIELPGVGRKPLRRYMIDAHIPASERDSIPVLADGERVMWLVGYRMSGAYQVHTDTKTVLAVTCRKAAATEWNDRADKGNKTTEQ